LELYEKDALMIKQATDPFFKLENNPECRHVGLSLRAATPEDESLLLETYASTRLSELESVPWDANQKRAFFKMQFDARQQQYRESYRNAVGSIVLQHGQPIGTMLVETREREIALVDIALLPQYRNAGLGTLLVKALMDEAASQQKTIRLHVLTTSAAVRFYERLGFRKTGDDGAYLEMTRKPTH
jgi:ribosomal protein S18 acetylase RimI-like enzyme